MIVNRFNFVSVPSKADIFVEQGSKFIASLKAVESEDDIKTFINGLHSAYPDATHICYAYILNPTNKVQKLKFNDDKEPSGTAGAPLLNLLKSKNIGNACLAVVRYFGGTLLGTAGLIKAYSTAGEKAIKAATLSPVDYSNVFEFEVEYNEVKKVENFVKLNGGKIIDSDYQEVVIITAAFASLDLRKITEKLQNELNRKIQITLVAQRYC